MKTETTEKLAVHHAHWQCENGHECLRWHQYTVYVGANPLGPRGGRMGWAVNARRIGAWRYRREEEAEAVAERYISEHPGTIRV